MTHRFVSKPILGIGALAIAAALFGGGLVAGRALEDGDGDTPASTDDGAAISPVGGPPFGGGFGPASTNESGADGDMARGAGMIAPPFGGCAAPLDPAIGNSFDFAATGLTLRSPGDGFVVTGISIRAEGDCDENGNATSGTPVIEYQWRHTSTGVTVWISQRAADEPVANVRYWNYATFTADDEVFTANAWGTVYPMAADVDAEVRAAAAEDAALPYPGYPNDPQVTEALDAAIAALAPSLPEGCFYTQVEGDWDDLAAFGVGDPRPALPAGYSAESINVTVFEAPSADCPDNGADAPEGDSFWASFTDGERYIQVNAYRYPGSERIASPMYVDTWGANWSSNGLSFSVYGSDDLGQETILAIARAMDSTFDDTCMIAPTELDEAALANLGFGVPAMPDGYTLIDSRLISRTLPEGCESGDEFSDSYELSWSYEDANGGQVQVHVSRTEGIDEGDSWGYISDRSVEWSRGGLFGSVWAYDSDEAPGADVLQAIALSVDPGLDVSTLEEGDGPKPMPVEDYDAPATSDGGGMDGDAGSGPETR